ncbi:MAG TPA: sigma-54 dependent transcriptional regulator [Enhygromyxa sp.]|nr:sigma-54 dependent transcriptional regulator [Enhygromyxa sp.]
MTHPEATRVLVVDDDDGVRYTLTGVLEDKGLTVLEARDGEQALALLERERERPIPLIISDLRMPKLDGMGMLAALRQRAVHSGEPLPKLVMITAHGTERLAVEAMKAGAYDYFRKPFEIDELSLVIDRALAGVRLEAENLRLIGERGLAQGMVFESPAMSRLAMLVHRVAPRDVTVLIIGESGTGKERVAEAIVEASSRAARPFVRFNCAALSAELAEAELFGHAKGSFTGAHRSRTGLFREADGGTLLLDEVGELDPSVQAKLLRVLQSGELRPVGQDLPIRVYVRLLAATHRDLAARVREGSFREDLYYRLKVVELAVPPLRERPEDIAPLTRHFLRRYAERLGVQNLREPADLLARLRALPWPGNVRQLENAIESLVALSADGELDLSLLPDEGAGNVAELPEHGADGLRLSLRQKLEAYEKGLLITALEQADGNRSEAAKALGIGRATLHDKLKKYGLEDVGGPQNA